MLSVILFLLSLALFGWGVVNPTTAVFWFALTGLFLLVALARWQRLRLGRTVIAVGWRLRGDLPDLVAPAPAGIEPDAPTPVGYPSVSERLWLLADWAAGRAWLIREGQELARLMRDLYIPENVEVYNKEFLPSVVYRHTGTWIKDADEFEKQWLKGSPLRVVSRLIEPWTYPPASAAKPTWRQDRVRDMEMRLDRLRKMPAPAPQPTIEGEGA